MPALAHGENGQPEAVLTCLARLVTARAEHVAKRIDGESGVVKNDGADEKADHKSHRVTAAQQATDEETESSGGDGWNKDIFIEPDQFRELIQILDDIRVIFLVLLGKDPSNVRPVEAFQLGRVEVLVGVGMLVVVAVMSGPPKSPLLRRRAAEESEAKLEEPARLVAAVGEIAVKSAGDAELTSEKHKGAERDGLHIDAGPDHGKACQMDPDEKKTRKR